MTIDTSTREAAWGGSLPAPPILAEGAEGVALGLSILGASGWQDRPRIVVTTGTQKRSILPTA